MKICNKSKHITVSSLCSKVGISRQAYYKDHHVRQQRLIDEEKILKEVKAKRYFHAKMGVRKLHYLLKELLFDQGVQVGRDKMFDVLRKHNLLVKRRRKYARTTDSKHWYNKYPNLVKDLELTWQNQVWVSDITYISTDKGFLYLALITDAYSRKIVGYDVSDSLEAVGCLRALKMALRDLPFDEYPIHHSDRGIQYCCKAYVKLLKKNDLTISMTEEDHCAENALAERVNGILKSEYMLDHKFKTKRHAVLCSLEAIRLYNTERPHLSINYQIPAQLHAKKTAEKKVPKVKIKTTEEFVKFTPMGVLAVASANTLRGLE